MTRCPAYRAAKIPEDIALEVAATVSSIPITVYYSLVHVARLCKGETILINAAAGRVGRTAIKFSHSIGAVVFATVENIHEKHLLMDHYQVPEDQIFLSGDMCFENSIMAITQQEGVDVALSCVAVEDPESTWRCLANLGRLVDISGPDVHANKKLDLHPYLQNRTYSAVDIAWLYLEKPKLIKILWLKCIALYASDALQPFDSITTFPYSQIEAAYQTLQTSENNDEIVLVPRLEDQIKVTIHTYTGPEDRTNFVRSCLAESLCLQYPPKRHIL